MAVRGGSLLNRRERIEKIRTLARRGSTEGERNAAKAALERMGESLEAPRPESFIHPSHPGSTFNFTPPQTRIFGQFFIDNKNANSFITDMFEEFNKRIVAMRRAGVTTEEINYMVVNGTFRDWKEQT